MSQSLSSDDANQKVFLRAKKERESRQKDKKFTQLAASQS